MKRNPACAELGAYVLGVLDATESDDFEEHLLDCPRCLSEIESLHSVRDLLLPLVEDSAEGTEQSHEDADRHTDSPPAIAPDDELLTELLRDVSRQQRRRTRQVAAVLAVAGTLLAAFGLVMLRPAARNDIMADPRHDSSPGPAVMLMMDGEQHSAADPRTGVSGAVGLEKKGWGTHVALQLSGVHGPLICSLVAVSKSGRHETVASWSIPSSGYGVPEHRDPLLIHGGTSLPHDQLDHFEVRAQDGRPLLRIPLS